MSHNQSIIIMAGGTGGHVYPALAVADAMKSKGVDVKWLGTKAGLEARVVPDNGYPLLTIDIGGVRGKGLLRKILSPFIILRAVFQSFRLLMQHKPSVVLGMGGFASGPGGIAAWLLRIPVMIHEQNAVAGMTNKILSIVATGVMQAFPDSFPASEKVVTTGNPVRQAILDIASPEERFHNRDNSYNLLIVGGSLGARKLNQTLPNAIEQVQENFSIRVRHQTGTKHFDDTEQAYSKTSVKAELSPFIENMASAYEWADVVVCRAGAMTIAELSVAGIPSVLVPYPYAVDDHQTANARYLSDASCAILIPEPELSIEALTKVLADLFKSRDQLLLMAEKVLKLGKPEATRKVAELCLEAGYVRDC